MGETVTINGREYLFETLPGKLDQGKAVYRLLGKRGASYYTMRNRVNPDLMFLVNEAGFTKSAPKAWLTDKDNVLRAVAR